MKHHFDFKGASREFVKEVNKDNRDEFFAIDAKQLQHRWTDVEIRRYRLPEQERQTKEREMEEERQKGLHGEGQSVPLINQIGACFDEEFSELAKNPAYLETINAEGATNSFVKWDDNLPEVMRPNEALP